MGTAATKAKRKFNKKTYDRIEIQIPAGEKEKIKEAAESEGKSVSAFIYEIIKEKIK